MNMNEKYAQLLVHYCLGVQHDDRVYIKTSFLAEPLVREIYREIIKLGAHLEIDWSFREQGRLFYKHAQDHQLNYQPTLYSKAMKDFDAYLYIRAPYNLKEDHDLDPEKIKKRQTALKPLSKLYADRTAEGSMRRSLCQFPTQASAQEAGMSLEEYEQFIFKACNLYSKDPEKVWLEVRKHQQRIVDYLNQVQSIVYRNNEFEISFSTVGRTWINSDGRTNMPSGEVFTGPVEHSVNGEVFFNYPSIFRGQELHNIRLWVEDGEVIKWQAEKGQEVLDEVFKIEGSRFFGEAAIGTNYQIQQATKNILFDEKIGGTIHMAIGQSYQQTGGKNQSPIHLDMIADMKDNGSIIADGIEIYKNGKFLI